MKGIKESASIILAARHAQKYVRPSFHTNLQYNYDLLCLKRQKNSKFIPGAYVFPGGMIHPSDTDPKWRNLFSAFGIDGNSFASLIPNATKRPQIFQPRANELPREISLRINAIRETFEECGILLCKKSGDKGTRSDWAQTIELSNDELQDWQKIVHTDATEFYTLCKNFDCYPDLWALYEWSNWLTPTFFRDRRFNTVFYMACLENMPNAEFEPSEIEDLKWDVPSNFAHSIPEELLAPPQHYELTRIAEFESIDNLLNFAIDRTKKGVKLILPVKLKMQDGNVYVMPGDSMYPEHADLYQSQIIDRSDLTIEQFREISPMKNRIEFPDREIRKLYIQNSDSEDGLLSSQQFQDVPVKQTHQE